MTRKRPDPVSLEVLAARAGLGRVMAYAGRPGTMAEARERARSSQAGFTNRIDDGPKWPLDEPEVLGPRRG